MWKANYTYPERYDGEGVTDRVLEYLSDGKRELTIVDVGCSIAVALKTMKSRLESMDVKVRAIGIDISTKVKEQAEKNLDLFINKSVYDVDPELYPADVVICSRAGLYLGYRTRAKLLEKCAKFLKADGALITDIDAFERPSWWSTVKTDFHDFSPVFKSLIRGPVAAYRSYVEAQHARLRRNMRIIYGRTDAESYPKKVIEGWRKLKWGQKFDWRMTVLGAAIKIKIRPFKPVSKPRKKK